MTVKSGLYVPIHGPLGDVLRLVDLCERAEQSGWDGFFIWDTVHTGVEPIADPLVVLSACAARTSRIALGALVTPLARRRPVKFARELLSLDQLSGGRIIAGLGLGTAWEFRRVGEPSSATVRAQRFEDGARLLDRLLHESEVTSPTFSLEEPLSLEPRPIRDRIPLWLGMDHDRPQGPRRAAALPVSGIVPMRRPWDVNRLLNPAELRGVVQAVIDAGARVDDVATIGRRDHPECQPLDEYVDAGLTWWLEQLHHEVDSERDMEEMISAGAPRW